jgi:hypothetical protein
MRDLTRAEKVKNVAEEPSVARVRALGRAYES